MNSCSNDFSRCSATLATVYYEQVKTSQRLVLHNITVSEIERMVVLMKKYQDTPMDLADASLIAVAESHSFSSVFTLDSDFYIYRLIDGSALEVIP